MNGLGGRPDGSRPTAVATVHEARAAVTALDRALSAGALAGPADAYHVMGSLALLTTTLQRSLGELAVWLREEAHHRRLTVVEGPFEGDPDAATAVAAQALVEASRSCQAVFDALERAHIATAHVGADVAPEAGTARRSLRRRRRA